MTPTPAKDPPAEKAPPAGTIQPGSTLSRIGPWSFFLGLLALAIGVFLNGSAYYQIWANWGQTIINLTLLLAGVLIGLGLLMAGFGWAFIEWTRPRAMGQKLSDNDRSRRILGFVLYSAGIAVVTASYWYQASVAGDKLAGIGNGAPGWSSALVQFIAGAGVLAVAFGWLIIKLPTLFKAKGDPATA